MNSSLDGLKAAASKAPIVPVLVVPDVAAAAPLANALVEGGLTTAEVTLRTPSGLKVIEEMKKACPELIVGAGTVLTGEDVRNSLAAGADFTGFSGHVAAPTGCARRSQGCHHSGRCDGE